ncbi:pyrroline-5-carboxylate reductase [Consotaella salsifontis]|uniref:Pyrroline-5-carboxylate reductase n=1 Tax=Consotaella salsifontis TaxID=1365950 RepID=A0A1T4PUC4_9HYPH|nr:pyrroline-5-carboxylate reductase [Consotaella salsifontis]SJZ95133.1 pyrroline-5-carboxylate reductase [Consotaella salsifontis]
MTAGELGTVLLVGAGNMGGALLSGWMAAGIEPGRVTMLDPKPGATVAAFTERGVHHVTEVPAATFDIVILAIKPQMMATVLPGLAPVLKEETLVVSIAAGTTIAFIEGHLGQHPTVRAMPNTPALIGRGITGCFANERASAAQRRAAESLLSACGPVEWLAAEDQINAVTALSGGGPAYVFLLAEALAEAGVAAGLDPALAMRLARHTVAGAGELMIRSEETPAKLRQNVTSPNGTTLAALNVLMAEGGLKALMVDAIAAAKARSEELSRE